MLGNNTQLCCTPVQVQASWYYLLPKTKTKPSHAGRLLPPVSPLYLLKCFGSFWLRAIQRSESLPLVCFLAKDQDGMCSATWRYDKGQWYSSSNIGSELLKRVSQIR